MSVSINGTNGLTFGDGSAQNTGGYIGFRNRIINGDMRIDQRNAGAVITPTNGQFSVDRFNGQLTQNGKFTLQQSSDAPSGFNKSIVATSTSSYSIAAGDIFQVVQAIEGYNIADLAFGSSLASPVTLSFWVKSSIAGLFSGALVGAQSYVFSFTINSVNTWEKKSITVLGSLSGTWETTNGSGLTVLFSLGCGSTYTSSAGTWTNSTIRAVTGTTSIVGTSGATFYITGVQLEKGSVATPFEFRPYGTELTLCQTYARRGRFDFAGTMSNTGGEGSIVFGTRMRTAPTFTLKSNGTALDGISAYSVTGTTLASSWPDSARLSFTASGTVAGRGANVVDGEYLFEAEL